MKERSLPLPGGCWKLQSIRLHQAKGGPKALGYYDRTLGREADDVRALRDPDHDLRADEQVAAEPAERGRSQGQPPRRVERAARDEAAEGAGMMRQTAWDAGRLGMRTGRFRDSTRGS
jgi:hypothetical protein